MKEKFLRELADIQTGPFGSQLHKEDYVADIAIQENLMPDWYRKEIGLSKVRLALTDTLDNGTPIGRAMAKRAAQSIVEKIVNAIAQESNTATSDNS